MKDEQVQQVRDALERTALRPCLKCGCVPADAAGMFTSPNAQKYGAPIGKDRFIFYPLCQECRKLPGVLTEVESYAEKVLGGCRN